MDLGSGIIKFYGSCPGGLMKKLLRENLDQVRRIKSLQTTYAKDALYGCLYACGGDLGIANNFIGAIDSLDELSINNYEKDVSILWPVIYRHAESLKSLKLHSTPEYYDFITVTPAIARRVVAGFPQLTHLTVDISAREAERLFEEATGSSDRGQLRESTTIDELVKMDHLKEIQLAINLDDRSSVFAGENKYDVMGSNSFPNVNVKNTLALARAIFNKFRQSSVQSSLEKVGIRFSRHCFSDRFQYDIVMTTVQVIRDGPDFKTEGDGEWDWNPERVSMGLWDQIVQADSEITRRAD
ncbi:unnamed protein product [Clonostachys rosea f. rosea IK726]|uniref:Uncharacterized protein n=1 Tax=Clonostachys rosea f. rosea IK726 TaxID=1349383 RepID=A0ACA9TYN9_BIOOC|nr:unnamed protein product [Clonostachys rosea f. rosea IK726]